MLMSLDPMRDVPWSPTEKKIARRAFDAALGRQCAVVTAKLKKMAANASIPADLWKIHDYLTEQRQNVDKVYDYRYSMLILVFARLLRDGWLTEADLEGIAEEKLKHIHSIANL
jgi:hypothetical protein